MYLFSSKPLFCSSSSIYPEKDIPASIVAPAAAYAVGIEATAPAPAVAADKTPAPPTAPIAAPVPTTAPPVAKADSLPSI